MFASPVQNTEYPGALSFIMGNGLRPSFTFTFNDKTKFKGGPGPRRQAALSDPPLRRRDLLHRQRAAREGDPGAIRGVLILDAQGNRNRFDFEGASQPDIDRSRRVHFTPPPGTNITRN